MNTIRGLTTLGLVLALGASQSAWAAEKEDDSVYSYGRWAVLSPAAGGAEPFVAGLTPQAVNNARPQDADEFDPKALLAVAPVEPPPGIDDVDPEVPIVTVPPSLPPLPVELEPGIVDVDPTTPIVTAPPSLPALPPL